MNTPTAPDFGKSARFSTALGVTFATIALVLAVAPTTLRAQLLAYESFNYTVGSGFGFPTGTPTGTGFDTGNSSGLAYAGSSSASVIQSGSLSYTDGNGVALTTSNNSYLNSGSGRLYALLDTSGTFGSYLRSGNIGANDTTIYLSVALRFTSSTGFAAFEINRDINNDSGRVASIDISNNTSHHPSTNFFVSRWDSSTTIGSAATLGANDTAVNFFVLRFDFASSGDTLSVYRNPTLASEPGSASAMITGSNLSFDRLALATFIGAGAVYMDEIRIGTTYASVTAVPEPGVTVLAFGSAAAALVLIRQRKRQD